MKKATKGRKNGPVGLALLTLLLAATLPATASASAPSHTDAETRVGVSSLEIPAGIKANSTLTQTTTRTYALRYDGIAVGYPLVPRGATAGARRAAVFGDNWQRASLRDTVERIAGRNPIVETTASGKRIFRNPDTGIQVVHDTAGNYFRVENPAAQGVGRYLDLYGNEIPGNVSLVGSERTTQIGVPRDLRNALTHFANVD